MQASARVVSEDTSGRVHNRTPMTAAETVRCWLVERSSYGDERMVTLVYATTDGERYLQKQFSTNLLMKKRVTAAIEAEPDRLESVDDADTRDRYATEAARMADKYAPDDEV